MNALTKIQDKASPQWCQQAAEVILNSYPNANPPDPETYIRALRTVLASLPDSVARKVASVETGIITKHNFLPTIAEVRKFAEPHLARMQANADWERGDKQLPPPKREPVDQRKAHVEAAMAKFRKMLPERERRDPPPVQCASGEAVAKSTLVKTGTIEP